MPFLFLCALCVSVVNRLFLFRALCHELFALLCFSLLNITICSFPSSVLSVSLW